MNVRILHLLEGAEKSTGLTVVIDVFRAFSTACYVFAGGAERIIPVGEVEEARNLKEENPDFLLIGERRGRKLSGFDYNNSPSEIVGADFSGKTVVLTTSSGTKGFMAARGSEELITGSLVNLDAVVSYIVKQNPNTVSIVPMGKRGVERADEDELCAEWMRTKLKGEGIDEVSSAIESLKEGDGRRFFEKENQNWSPEEDFYLCTDVNRFDFVVKAEPLDGDNLVLKKIEA